MSLISNIAPDNNIPPLKIALVGIGNCCKSFVEYLLDTSPKAGSSQETALGRQKLGGLRRSDISIVAAFDIDSRKVGRDLADAILAIPNCALDLCSVESTGILVQRGPTLDGLPEHLKEVVLESEQNPVSPESAAEMLVNHGVEVVVVLVPSGSDRAVEWWAEVCISSGISMINCTPTFLAQRKDLMLRFRQKGGCYIGDDLKSQLGATILHRSLLQVCSQQGVVVSTTWQINTGGNSDFLNLVHRGKAKATSKLNSLAVADNCRSDVAFTYDHQRGDRKTAVIHIEGHNPCGTPFSVRASVEVEDSPNAVAVLVDAVRCAGAARRKRIYGYLEEASQRLMKSPIYVADEWICASRYEQFVKSLSE